jgi:hypothetical protein
MEKSLIKFKNTRADCGGRGRITAMAGFSFA